MLKNIPVHTYFVARCTLTVKLHFTLLFESHCFTIVCKIMHFQKYPHSTNHVVVLDQYWCFSPFFFVFSSVNSNFPKVFVLHKNNYIKCIDRVSRRDVKDLLENSFVGQLCRLWDKSGTKSFLFGLRCCYGN